MMGIFIAAIIISSWGAHLFYCLKYADVSPGNVFLYLHILLQAYMYTGLFITAHDAMHGNITKKRTINNLIGKLASFLFAALSYNKLFLNHHTHHAHPGTEKDPDFYPSSRNFFAWWFVFLKHYISVIQIILMAVIFNLLKIFFAEISIWLFFVLPVILSTFQLFYFGTYLPHRLPHEHLMPPHNSRTQKKNHIIAMLSCYFFGYHLEHHTSPKTAWWQLYRTK
ncbi:MAG: fatty acid desaturase [bacterium]|nr:fatty acid desaturase [bacterium]